jgi:uncharacterized membrane protein
MNTHTLRRSELNAGDVEHIAALSIGGLLMLGGLTRKGAAGWLLRMAGSAMLVRGATGYEPLYRALGVQLAKTPTGVGRQNVRVESTVVINRSPRDVYRIWRNLENLPVFMTNLVRVTEIDDTHSHWVSTAPAGLVVEWDAEIINDIEDEIIAWQTLEGSSVDTSGSVHFEPTENGGTRLRVVLRYDPPADNLGVQIARLFHTDPQVQIDRDLRRFKRIMEVPMPGSSAKEAAKSSPYESANVI